MRAIDRAQSVLRVLREASGPTNDALLLLLRAGRVVCTLHSHLDVLFCTCSIITLVAIALDRWCARLPRTLHSHLDLLS